MIAEFMGEKELISESDFLAMEHKAHNPTIIEYLRYNSSWDWLMPVVEKIEKLDYIKVESNYQNVENDWQCLIVKSNDIIIQEFDFNHIDAMYQAVVQFIEWYNKQK